MEILKFKLSGKSAFFKKPEVNTYCYFTYGNIHRVALLGILGAILGYKGYSQMQDILSNKKKKGKLEPSYPEFYEKLKDLKIAILPLNNKGIISKKIQIFNNSVGYASFEQGGNLIVREQWLENPKWIIYVLIDRPEAQALSEAMLQNKCVYIPYLGSNDHPADITGVEILEGKETVNYDKIDTLFYRNKVSYQAKKGSVFFNMNVKIHKYEEYLPVALDEALNQYILKPLVYTNAKIERYEDKVYTIADKVVAFI